MGAVRFLSPPRERNPRQRFCAGAKAMSENAIAKMTMRQAEEEMACFRKIYSIVRLLDLKTIEEAPCYAPWREAHPCTRCIGREALLCKGQKSKLEHVGSQIYQATARYVEVDGNPYVMEMIQPLEPDSDALSHEDKRLYTDALTGVYNRRFYEDELRHKFLTAGVAMIDLDDFKLCNDTFGHEAGDAALCAVASIIQHNIRSSDMLIRYGGDELLLILPMIPADDFARKLRLINKKLSGARVPGFERLRITSSIGGVLSAGVSIEEAVKLADKRMYQAKRQKNMVVTENEPQNVLNVQSQPRPTVLIVDDSPMNREILTEILGKDFQLLEASDGAQCMSLLKQFGSGISLVLLDIVMPDMDGFEVLARMAGQDLLNDLPVIMVSSEDSSTVIHRAYELGASDFIRRPFDARIVHRRVSNITKLYARQRRLSRMVAQQFYEREKNNRLMIAILSQVTERHNGENGLHIQRIQHRLQEIQALLLRVHQRHTQIRPCQRQRQPRKSRARADVNQRRALRNQFRNRQRHQAVNIVAVNHVRLFRHSGQIHLCVPFQQQFVVFQQLSRQVGRKGNPAFLQALFQHFFRHFLHSSGR